MKYNDNGEYKDIYIKTFDTLPVGTEVDYDGETVPTGWSEISGYEEVDPTDYITISNSFTLASGSPKAYKCGNLVFFNFDIISGTINNGETQLGTCTNKLVVAMYGMGRCMETYPSTNVSPATTIAIPSGAFRIYTTMAGTRCAGTIILLVND